MYSFNNNNYIIKYLTVVIAYAAVFYSSLQSSLSSRHSSTSYLHVEFVEFLLFHCTHHLSGYFITYVKYLYSQKFNTPTQARTYTYQNQSYLKQLPSQILPMANILTTGKVLGTISLKSGSRFMMVLSVFSFFSNIFLFSNATIGVFIVFHNNQLIFSIFVVRKFTFFHAHHFSHLFGSGTKSFFVAFVAVALFFLPI